MQTYFTDSEIARIVKTIREAEATTSGEIRVHVERRCWRNQTTRAAAVFNKLDMHQTKDRNGVLIYLAMKSCKFAIIGDSGINQYVPLEFWQDLCNEMQNHLQNGAFCEGICSAVQLAGKELNKHFPRRDDDQNELSDSVSFG